MNILVFGASGGTGKEVVSQALQQGNIVTAFVREASKLTDRHDRLKVVEGNVADYRVVEGAVRNQDAVVSTLGVSKPLRRDKAVVEGIENILKAMDLNGVRRFIYQSYPGDRESRRDLGFLIHYVAPVILRNEFADHELKEKFVTASRLDWTIVRPATLTNKPFTGTYRDGERIVPLSGLPFISRADVANFILKQLSDSTYLFKRPRVMY